MAMELTKRFQKWHADHEERKTQKLTAAAADIIEDQQYDLLVLHKRGFVRAKGTGESITKIYADVENLIRKKLNVVVTPGTYLVSSGRHQNMAVTTEYRFTLAPCETLHCGFDAVCINADRPIPASSDYFSGVARVSDTVARFLTASKDEHPMVIQAGVWTLTDQYSRYQIINHLISRDRFGNVSHPITHNHCNRAMVILDGLGISHTLWYSSVPYEKRRLINQGGEKPYEYDGELAYGLPHGHGKITFKDGDSYEGEWKACKPHGRGKAIFQNGDSYDGGWKDGRAQGSGTLTFKSGLSYEGSWESGQPVGIPAPSKEFQVYAPFSLIEMSSPDTPLTVSAEADAIIQAFRKAPLRPPDKLVSNDESRAAVEPKPAGLGPSTSKGGVDPQRSLVVPAGADVGDAIAEIETLLYSGKVIDAIKCYRAATGCSLIEAKDSVMAYEKHLRAVSPKRFSAFHNR